MIEDKPLTNRLGFILPALTLVCGVVLIASAFYNQWLWASEPRPSNELTRRVVSIQASMVMALVVLMMSNFVSAIIQGLKKRYQGSVIGLAAASFAMIALIFTMAYDQASIFFQ